MVLGDAGVGWGSGRAVDSRAMPRADPRRARSQPRAARPPAPKPVSWLQASLHGNPAVSAAEALLETRIGQVFIALVGVALLAMALGPHAVGDYFAETDFYGDYAKGAQLI